MYIHEVIKDGTDIFLRVIKRIISLYTHTYLYTCMKHRRHVLCVFENMFSSVFEEKCIHTIHVCMYVYIYTYV